MLFNTYSSGERAPMSRDVRDNGRGHGRHSSSMEHKGQGLCSDG